MELLGFGAGGHHVGVSRRHPMERAVTTLARAAGIPWSGRSPRWREPPASHGAGGHHVGASRRHPMERAVTTLARAAGIPWSGRSPRWREPPASILDLPHNLDLAGVGGMTDRQTDILLTEKKSQSRLICHRNERDMCTCIYKIVSLLKSYDNIHGMTYTTKIMLSGIVKIKTGYFDNINDYY